MAETGELSDGAMDVVGNKTFSYTYNADGIRTGKAVNGIMTNYLLDGGNVIAEYEDGSVTEKYLWGMNLIRWTSGTDVVYYNYNAHGDVVQLTNSSGTITKSYTYDAFGNELNRDEDDQNPFRYCGEYYDKETGTYYLRARYYSPFYGRFACEDPARDGPNWYTYCRNDPVNRIDPSGLKDYIYRSQSDYYIENDWGMWDFLNTDCFFIEINGNRYLANSRETVTLYDWTAIDSEFLSITLGTLVNRASEKKTSLMRVLTQSVGGELDFKLQLENNVLYLANGVAYNKNEAGNFVWAYFLERNGFSGYFSGILAQGGSLVPPILSMGGKPRLDENWDRRARWEGIKYYYQNDSSVLLYFIRYSRFPHI